MNREVKAISLIPARGGSKGIKNKNLIPLKGKPLIAYTIEAALNSKCSDRTVVTTDSQEIAEVSRKYGAEVPFIRPVKLAADQSKTIDVVLHAINTLKQQGSSFDILILLQPTSPLRTSQDIDNAFKTFMNNGRQPLVSISPVAEHPLLIRYLNDGNHLGKILSCSSTCRRQEMPSYYKVNGSIYINSVKSIDKETSFNDNLIPYIMIPEHSVDIDSMVDLAVAEYYLGSHHVL